MARWLSANTVSSMRSTWPQWSAAVAQRRIERPAHALALHIGLHRNAQAHHMAAAQLRAGGVQAGIGHHLQFAMRIEPFGHQRSDGRCQVPGSRPGAPATAPSLA